MPFYVKLTNHILPISLVPQDTEPIVISSEDIEVVIRSDEDEPELSETEELSLANHFSAFKGKTFDFSLKLVNPDKMSKFQTVQMGKGGVNTSVTSLKAFISQCLLPNSLVVNIESVEYGYLGPGHGARAKRCGYTMMILQLCMKLTLATELSICGATHMLEKSAPVNLRPCRDLNLSSIVRN